MRSFAQRSKAYLVSPLPAPPLSLPYTCGTGFDAIRLCAHLLFPIREPNRLLTKCTYRGPGASEYGSDNVLTLYERRTTPVGDNGFHIVETESLWRVEGAGKSKCGESLSSLVECRGVLERSEETDGMQEGRHGRGE